MFDDIVNRHIGRDLIRQLVTERFRDYDKNKQEYVIESMERAYSSYRSIENWYMADMISRILNTLHREKDKS